MVEAGGIGKGGRATAGEDMDGAMADCGGHGMGGGARCLALCFWGGELRISWNDAQADIVEG